METPASGNPAEGAGAPPAGPNQGQNQGQAQPPGDKPPATPPPPKEPELVRVLPADWQSMHSELDTLRKERDERTAEIQRKQAETLEVAAKKANVEQQFADFKAAYETRHNELQGKHLRLEQEIREEKLETTLAQALAGVPLAAIPGVDTSVTAAQLRQLLANEIESIRGQDGKFRVQSKKTLQDAAVYLKERLESPEFAHFLKAPGKGGSGTGDAGARPAGQDAQHTPGAPEGEGKPGSLGHIVADWRNRQAQYQAFGMRPNALGNK